MTQEEVASKVYDSEANLTYTSEMTTFSKELGFESEETVGSINLLKEWIRKGCPLVVLQKLSITDDYGHYRVIVGYDDEDGTVITNDPIYGDNYNLSYSDFMELWKPGKTFSTVDWTLLTTPQNKVLADLMEKNQLSLNQIPQFSYEELKGVIDILVSKVNLLSIVSAFSAIYAAAITIVYFRHKQRKFSPLLHKPKEFTARRDMARFLGLCCYFPFFHFSSD